ncbi:MAG: DUF6639 family protein [Burkholderiales bacterium]
MQHKPSSSFNLATMGSTKHRVALLKGSGQSGCSPQKIYRFKTAGMVAWAEVAMLVGALIGANSAYGDELRCPNRNVVVHSAARGDAETACEAAGEAIAFLASHGLDTTRAVEIHLVSKLPDIANKSAAGCYDHPHRRTYMLIFSACSKQGRWFELPLDRALYKSLVAHEVAHAVAAANFSVPKPSILAQEYIAYVTQLATMPPRHLARVLERFPGNGFDSAAEMSLTFYTMNPSQFGVEVYRHFLKPGNGEAFLKEVLSGRVLIDEGAAY